MQYRIQGLKRDTGKEATLTIEADDEAGAIDQAHARGCAIQSIRRIREPVPADPRDPRRLRWGIAGVTALLLIGLGGLALRGMRTSEPSTSESFAQGMLAELRKPPLEWSSRQSDPFDQSNEYQRWSNDHPIVPEVDWAVDEFLLGDETHLDTIITNGPTGAEYRLTGEKTDDKVVCRIKFVWVNRGRKGSYQEDR